MEKSNLPIFKVSDLIASINQTFEYAYPVVMVEGEVASFKVNQNKYVFFDIKDESGTLNCFMTVWQMRMPIEDGMKIVVTATPKITAWGKFSLTVQSIKPVGEGSLKKSFEILKKNLEKEGLFSPERKRILPTEPQRVAVISSTQAAGYADFIKIINDRWGGMTVDVAHVQVQGEAAPDQIIKAIRYFNELQTLPEVLVIIRGGGSADDLSAFNDELLVREIAKSRTPTLVGIGHETDTSLAELVADVRAATPSNAAQILVPDKKSIIQNDRQTLKYLASQTQQIIEQTEQQVKSQILGCLNKTEYYISQELDSLRQTYKVIEAYSPIAILRRGYALLRGNIKINQNVEIETIKQLITAEVKNVRSK